MSDPFSQPCPIPRMGETGAWIDAAISVQVPGKD